MTITEIWRQTAVPVVYRQGAGMSLLVKLPFSEENKLWLRNNNKRKLTWVKQYKCWATPCAWFEEVAYRTLHKFRSLYVIQPHNSMEKCAPACWNAKGLLCECSCLGERHGSADPAGKWWIVSETCAVQWHKRELVWRLLQWKPYVDPV